MWWICDGVLPGDNGPDRRDGATLCQRLRAEGTIPE